MFGSVTHPGRRLALAVWLILAFGSPVFAQTIVDARRVEFGPSADHNSVDPTAGALVTSYRIDIFLAGGSVAVQSANLGKPAPDADGLIRVDFVALLPAPLTAGTIYEARVFSMGPGGSSSSGVSNTFGFSAPCAPTPASSGASMSSAGGSGTVGVSAASGCGWTATSNAGWITVTSGATGSGPGTVGYSVAANTGTAQRSGTITIGSATFTVTQSGVPCSFSVTPLVASVVAAGGTASMTVTTGTGCAWTATEAASWLSVTAGATGNGNGTVTVTATANPASTARSAPATVAGATVTINQPGVPCTFTLSAASQSFTSSGGSGTVGVTAPAGCAWTAVSSAAFLTVTSGASGSGSGTVGFGVAANSGTTARSATLTMGGATFTVQQAVATCAFSVSTTAPTLPANGGTVTVLVTTGPGCAWSTVGSATWLTLVGGSGSGSGSVGLSAQPNTTKVARSVALAIAGQAVTVAQAANNTPNAPNGLKIVK